MDISKVRKTVGKLKANLFKKANSHSIGVLKTNFKGTGLQFKEHQIYTFGDDVRFIDWKILAKTNHPYVKTFNEERNVEIVVLIDASLTMLNGYNGVSKLQAAIEICCLLYLLAKETNDFVHAVVVTDEVINLPKINGDKGISLLIKVLQEKQILNTNGDVNLERIVDETVDGRKKYVSIMRHLAKKREMVILSDFNDFLDDDSLMNLLSRPNVHSFQILSPLDEAHKVPYMIFASSSPKERAGLGKYAFEGVQSKLDKFGKKIRKIKVKEAYLEEFLKEMRK